MAIFDDYARQILSLQKQQIAQPGFKTRQQVYEGIGQGAAQLANIGKPLLQARMKDITTGELDLSPERREWTRYTENPQWIQAVDNYENAARNLNEIKAKQEAGVMSPGDNEKLRNARANLREARREFNTIVPRKSELISFAKMVQAKKAQAAKQDPLAIKRKLASLKDAQDLAKFNRELYKMRVAESDNTMDAFLNRAKTGEFKLAYAQQPGKSTLMSIYGDIKLGVTDDGKAYGAPNAIVNAFENNINKIDLNDVVKMPDDYKRLYQARLNKIKAMKPGAKQTKELKNLTTTLKALYRPDGKDRFIYGRIADVMTNKIFKDAGFDIDPKTGVVGLKNKNGVIEPIFVSGPRGSQRFYQDIREVVKDIMIKNVPNIENDLNIKLKDVFDEASEKLYGRTKTRIPLIGAEIEFPLIEGPKVKITD